MPEPTAIIMIAAMTEIRGNIFYSFSITGLKGTTSIGRYRQQKSFTSAGRAQSSF
jgi:hypothetical protein